MASTNGRKCHRRALSLEHETPTVRPPDCRVTSCSWAQHAQQPERVAAAGERNDMVGGEVAGAAALGAVGLGGDGCSCASLVVGAVAAFGRAASSLVTT